MRSRLILALSALAPLVSAQKFAVGWFASTTCDTTGNATFSIVYGDTDLCQAVPQNQATAGGTFNANAGYQVHCNADNQGGIISFHDTAPDCPVQNQQQHPFANGECIANAPGFGAVAFSVACNPDVPTNPAVPDGNFAAEWFEEADCALTAAGHQTIVVGAQDLCQVVPQRQTVAGANDNNNNNNNNDNNNNNNNNNQQPAPSNLPTANFNTLAGYSVQCFADGTGGVVRFSSTGTCDNVQASTPFQSGVCLANPAQFGSASVKFFCAGRTTAQQPTTHARLTWYEDGSCNVDDNNHRTIVVARQGFCQRVPDRDLGYRITCEADQNGNQNGKGTVQFCDANCGSCPFVHNLDSNVCTANAAGYGSAAYKLSCQPADVNNTPTIGDVVVKWIEEANCANEATHFTQLILPQTLCHTVPNATNVGTSGYKITCDGTGTAGVFNVCNADCSSCTIQTPFTNGQTGNALTQCLANPAATGSQSVRFQCMPPAVNGTADNNTNSASGLGLSFTGGMAALGAAVAAAAFLP